VLVTIEQPRERRASASRQRDDEESWFVFHFEPVSNGTRLREI
jgi:hypothetical protein